MNEHDKQQKIKASKLRDLFYKTTGRLSSSFPSEFRAFVAGFDLGCESKQKEIDRWKDLETEAANFVEAPIVMRTHFTGEPPYVGWEGLGLALTETLDELANAKKEIASLQAQLREQHQNQLDLMERIPVNPEEVYSPNTIVIDDKCRKCAGQMRDGKAIEQTATGYPDFVGESIVTMSSGGMGKMIDCMKCQDCGWSAMK